MTRQPIEIINIFQPLVELTLFPQPLRVTAFSNPAIVVVVIVMTGNGWGIVIPTQSGSRRAACVSGRFADF